MKYTIEAVDDKVIETLEVKGSKFIATWETGEGDEPFGPFCSQHAVGKSLDTQIQEAFECDDALATDLEDLMSNIAFLSSKFFNFIEAWGE